jgi:hypothetical protein
VSQLLPYFGVGLLLLAALVLWARQSLTSRKGSVELSMPCERPRGGASATPRRDLGERIFDPHDWDFVRHETTSEIQRMFQQERTVLAISWLRRTRRQVSLVMRTHAAGVRRSKNLQPAVELKLLLSYLSLVMLCDFLISLVWLRGPVRTRRIVGRTFQWTAQLRAAFEQLIAIVDPANHKALETGFNQGTAQS